MDLAPFVDNVRQELAVAAEAGGDEARSMADRLAAALESTIRLTLLEALSAAADEITRDLAPGSVDVRLRGRDATFVVTSPPPFGGPTDDGLGLSAAGPPSAPAAVPGAGPAALSDGDEGAMARINLRLPEQLKTRVEEAASRAGLSVNAWLVRATAAAVEQGGAPARRTEPGAADRRLSGWVR